MLSPLRNRFGIPGVISVIALVFAMLGGAYAASNGSGGGKATASAKAKKGPRGPRGPVGPAGPAGSVGPAGPAGKDGTNGTNGVPGADGTSAKAVAFAGNEHGCTEGGIEVTSASPVVFVCNGKKGTNGSTVLNGSGAPSGGNNGDFYIKTGVEPEIFGPKAAGVWPGSGTKLKGPAGSPWVVDTAPTGAVLKGTWSIQQYTAAAANETIPVPISTSVPIPSTAMVFADAVPFGGPDPLGEVCTGTAVAPTPATPEFEEENWEQTVCLYEQAATNLNAPTLSGVKDAQSGGGMVALFRSAAAGVVNGYGTWAFKIPIP